MTFDNALAAAKRDATLAEVAALVTSEAVALCSAALQSNSASFPVLQRAMRHAREVRQAVVEDRADETTANWALEIAAVALTEARREIALGRAL